jgi:PKD repeat protein
MLSNEATVTVTVNNLAPTIQAILSPDSITEGSTVQFSATATDSSHDALSYSWNFGDGSLPSLGQTITHSFADNGTYSATLTVTDSNGSSSTQTFVVTVNNAAPIVTAGVPQTIHEGQALDLSGYFSDAGALDTHTIAWELGDGSFIAHSLIPRLTVIANEPINGKGDGNSDYDYEITPDGRVLLRAEHSGNGNGRIYTLTYRATDNAGNQTLATTTVRVPKNQGS